MKPGDLVKLKSGGPGMVVSDVLPHSFIVCQWFDLLGEHHVERFRVDILEPISSAAKKRKE